MDKLLAVDELRLSRFGEFLLRQRLIKQGSERYYLIWVRKFLARPAQVPITSLEDRVARYLEELQSCGGYRDWQIDQAEKAVRLYFVNFTRESQTSKETSTTLPKNPDGTVEGPKLIATLLDLLRVKHYAYTTERTYLGWISYGVMLMGSFLPRFR